MSKKASVVSIAVGALVATAGAWAAWGGGDGLWRWPLAFYRSAQATWPVPRPAAVAIPFELVGRHVLLKVSVNGSRPLSFVLDTGDRFAVVDLDRARELGLTLGGELAVVGAGSNPASGAFVQGAAFSLPGFPGFSQAVPLAISLRPLAPRLGHDLDGLLGADFIRHFVVELDYRGRVMTLHDKDEFAYSGPGESIPMRLNAEHHPVIEAEVRPVGGAPIRGAFLLDIGAGNALVLHSPFVREHQLPCPNVRTMENLGGGGTGGAAAGRLGPVAELRIGRFTLSNPITLFSEDRAGAYANPAIQGSIGQQVVANCRLFLDYSHERIILEPTGSFAERFERASSGLRVEAEGPDYKTFRVANVARESPGSEAGLQENDVITAIDDREAAELTLGDVLELFERPAACGVTVRRGESTLSAILTPRQIGAPPGAVPPGP